METTQIIVLPGFDGTDLLLDRFRARPLTRVERVQAALEVILVDARKLSENDLRWADVVFVMEKKHRSRIIDEFRSTETESTIPILDIPDDYLFMDPELIDLIQERVEDYFDAERL